MRENKKKIKGASTRLGIIFTSAMLATSPIAAYADELENNNQVVSYEKQGKTDLEKYFNCEIPMDESYQVTTDSSIYKILSFYEGRPKTFDGQFAIERDAYGNLVVASGLTLKYQKFLLDYLSDYGSTMEEIDSTINSLMNSGITVYIEQSIIEQGFIQEIQQCRNNAINDAKKLNINLSENQINILTEMNYRYGKANAGRLFEFLLQGGKLEDFTIVLERSMSQSVWDTTNLKNYYEVQDVREGNVYYKTYIKPFNGLGKEATYENLSSVDIATELKNAESDQLEGDWRRCLFRQVGIENDICALIINSSGTCRYLENGEEKETNIVNYLSNIKQNNIENLEYSTYLNIENAQEVSISDNLYLQTEEVLENNIEDNYVEAEEILETGIEDDNSVEIEQELENNVEDNVSMEIQQELESNIEPENIIHENISNSEKTDEYINSNSNQKNNTSQTSLVPIKKDTWYQKIIQGLKNIGIISAGVYASSNLIKKNRKKIRKIKRKAKRRVIHFLNSVIENREEKQKRNIKRNQRTSQETNQRREQKTSNENIQIQDNTTEYKGLSKQRRAQLFAELRRQAQQQPNENYSKNVYRKNSRQVHNKYNNNDDIDRVS